MKIPVDMMWLVSKTPVKDQQLTLVWKTHNNNNDKKNNIGSEESVIMSTNSNNINKLK